MSDKVYVIRVSDPLDMEGSADVLAVFFDEQKANEKAEKLTAKNEASAKEAWGERYLSFCYKYEVEEWEVSDAE